MTETPKATPVDLSQRILSLDILRGVAVLGILIMNIQGFAMIEAAYFNPTAYGDLSGPNHWVYVLSHVLADQKFMALFSVLFGAGMVLMAENIERQGVRPARRHYTRSFWLIVFGLLHAYLLWFGDILFTYGMCALVVYFFRRLSPRWLLVLGLVVLAFGSALYVFFAWSIPYWPPEQLASMTEQMWAPGAERVAAEVAAYTDGYFGQMSHRVPSAIGMQTGAFLFYLSWRAAALMLIGMALYKWGVLSARLSARSYLTMAVIGLGVGIPVVAYGVHQKAIHDWSFGYSFFLGSQYNFWGSLLVAAGYLGVVMLAVRSSRLHAPLQRLAAVGRMAFTNYMLQTVLCTLVFYGHGLGLFGSVERTGQILVVVAVWVVLLIVSPLWLKHYRFGPLEWLWRSLTYWKPQGMRRAGAEGGGC